MVRLLHAYFPTRTLLLAVSEAMLVVLALLAAVFAKFRSDVDVALRSPGAVLQIANYSVIFLLCMYYYDLYDSSVLVSPREVKARLVQVLGTTSIILAFLYYADPEIEPGRGILLLGIFFSGLLLIAWREVFFVFNRSARLAERVVLLGDVPAATALAAEIEKRPELGVRVIGLVSHTADEGAEMGVLPRLGGLEELPHLVARERAHRIIVSMRECRGKLPVNLLLRLKTQGVLIQDGADVFETITGKVPLDSIRVSWLLFSEGFRVSKSMQCYKRAFSIVFSVLGLILSLPLMLLVALAIRLDSEGPVIFCQPRMGKDGKVFTLYKFRSMRDGLKGEGQFKAAQTDDNRFTRVGRWLRRTRLDELPQLWNILRGDIDFVGPRPFVPEQEKDLMREIPFYNQRLTVKPGATGWAQVNRGYCATLEDNAEKLAYDLFYIKNISIGLDLLILFKTVKILLLGRGGR